jgi:hypothetical protein
MEETDQPQREVETILAELGTPPLVLRRWPANLDCNRHTRQVFQDMVSHALARGEPLEHSFALLGEDDVVPAPDALEFLIANEYLFAHPGLLCISLWGDRFDTVEQCEPHLRQGIKVIGWFSSWGSYWRLDRIRTMLEVWQDDWNDLPLSWDIQVRTKVLDPGRMVCAFPFVPRCRNIGTWGRWSVPAYEETKTRPIWSGDFFG